MKNTVTKTTNALTSQDVSALFFMSHLKDHLGNVRIVFADKDGDGYIEPFNVNPTEPNSGSGGDGAPIDLTNTDVLQETHYYPFGMTMEGEWQNIVNDPENNYLYNGKELQTDFGLDLHDYGARYYDAAIGRFTTTDRFAEKYTSITPYQYGANNPILFIDINGDSLDVFEANGNDGSISEFNQLNNDGMGGFFSTTVGEDGNVSIQSTGKEGNMTIEQLSYFMELSGIIDSKNTTSVNLVNNDSKVPLVDLRASKLDVGDMSGISDANLLTKSGHGVLIHELKEQSILQNSSIEFDPAHATGIEVENRVDNSIRIPNTYTEYGNIMGAGGMSKFDVKRKASFVQTIGVTFLWKNGNIVGAREKVKK